MKLSLIIAQFFQKGLSALMIVITIILHGAVGVLVSVPFSGNSECGRMRFLGSVAEMDEEPVKTQLSTAQPSVKLNNHVLEV